MSQEERKISGIGIVCGGNSHRVSSCTAMQEKYPAFAREGAVGYGIHKNRYDRQMHPGTQVKCAGI